MKKCGIVTIFDDNYNYGGQLQAYAMCELFKSQGFEPEIISFQMSKKSYLLQRIKQLGLKEFFKRVANRILFKVLKYKDEGSYRRKIEKYKKFMKMTPHTKKYNDKNIYQTNDIFDFFVCGSDQIWNPGWWNDIYFLQFATKPKFSYAASIARNELTDKEKDYIRSRTADYIGVSVRENPTSVLLNQFLEKKVYSVLDPTLMVNKDIWERLLESNVCNDEYALIYKIGPVSETVKNVYKYCKSKGIKVIMIGHAKNTYDRGDVEIADYIVDDAGPIEWLNLINNASYIFTDSFHGTVFSVLFNKRFWCFEKDKGTSTEENSRLYSLLGNLDIKDRMLRTSEVNPEILETKIQYDVVQKKLAFLRDESFNYLKMCFERL